MNDQEARKDGSSTCSDDIGGEHRQPAADRDHPFMRLACGRMIDEPQSGGDPLQPDDQNHSKEKAVQ